MNPIIVSIGNFELRWYSVFLLLGVLSVLYVINKEVKRFKLNTDIMFNMCFWGIVFGIIGGRIYYVIFNWNHYSQNVLEILEIWKGGIAIHGCMIGAILTVFVYTHKYHIRPIRYLDFIMAAVPLGQAIGRWGNFFNSEAHGAATTLEHLKNLHIPRFIIDGMKIEGVYYTPTFFYESLACLILFIVLMIFRRGTYRKVGSVTALYFIGYGIIRFFIEISRTDALMIAGFKMAQIASVILIIIGVIILIGNSRKSKFEDLYNDKNNIDNIQY